MISCLSFEIDARENGIHSLAEALKAFKEFHDDHKKIYALKDAILRSQHAIEALFKYALFRIDPILLLEADDKVKDIVEGYKTLYKSGNESILDNQDTVTITLDETIRRLHDFGVIKGVADEAEFNFYFDAVKKLSAYRNKLQHFRLKAEPELLARILGGVLPRSIIIIEATYAEIAARSQGQILRIFGLQPIQSELDKIYPDWKTVYGILANDYDELIQNAIKAFKKQTFKDVTISLTIDDHGNVGAPPYYPEIKSEGFLVFEMEPHMMWTTHEEQTGEGFPYSGEVKISEPQFTAGTTLHDKGIAKGTIELAATVYLDASKMLKLPNVEKEISVLRGMKAKIQASLNYEAESLMMDWHYSADKITKANGQLNIVVEIMPMGSKSSKEELIGEFKADLTENNAPFRLHTFRNPDGSLRGNRSLDWNINTKGDLTFL